MAKTRIQTMKSAEYKNSLDCIVKTARSEGLCPLLIPPLIASRSIFLMEGFHTIFFAAWTAHHNHFCGFGAAHKIFQINTTGQSKRFSVHSLIKQIYKEK